MPASVSQYVLKVHSRCDLACDHCYVYEQVDQSWRGKPAAIAPATAARAAGRIAEHAALHRLTETRIILHGGEPLLLGRDRMRQVLATLKAQITPVSRLDLRVHTNGVQLDELWCRLFVEYGVKVGISLDGDQTANDRHRRFANGRSSYPQVHRALCMLRQPQYRHLFAGVLCTIDVSNDPISVYEAIIAERPPRLDFLLPHATWESPPARPADATDPYAAWLIRIYDRWVRDDCPVPIRLFDSLISTARGGPSLSEAVGLDPVALLVIETDGTWEQADSLKVAYAGAPETGLNVFSHPVDAVALQPEFAARQGGISTVSAVCRACPVVRICGGGLYAHRYRTLNGFDNPSVYCGDLKALISHITAGLGKPAGQADSHASHTLPAGAFAALAAGPGSAEAIRSLTEMRLSLTRSLVAAVAAEEHVWENGRLRDAARAGWALLCQLDAEQPETVREIFLHPYTYAWAVRCLIPPAGADRDLDRAHLASLGAAAALRAGATAQLPLPVRDGQLHVPAAGAMTVSAGWSPTVMVSIAAGRLMAGDRDGRWEPARRLAVPGLDIQVEDLDPFRDCQEWPVAARLSDRDWSAWRRSLEAAGTRLASDVPAYARAISTGLRSIVPLRDHPAGQRSSSARQAFGAVALALPPAPRDLDALILHEFQHVKLHALLDLHQLLDPQDRRLVTVPWRPDPRPLEGVLHGTYAHLALAHYCRARGPAHQVAYLRYQAWVSRGVAVLLSTGSLTVGGQRFIAGMLDAVKASQRQ
jgi:uncharacterized protein